MQRNERKRETKGGGWRVEGEVTVGNVVRESLFPRSFGKNGQVPFITLAIHTTQVAGYLLAKVSRDTSRNIAVAVGSTGCGRRRPSLCTTGGRRDARSQLHFFLLFRPVLVVSSYKRLPFRQQREIYVLVHVDTSGYAYSIFSFLRFIVFDSCLTIFSYF